MMHGVPIAIYKAKTTTHSVKLIVYVCMPFHRPGLIDYNL